MGKHDKPRDDDKPRSMWDRLMGGKYDPRKEEQDRIEERRLARRLEREARERDPNYWNYDDFDVTEYNNDCHSTHYANYEHNGIGRHNGPCILPNGHPKPHVCSVCGITF